MFRCLLRKGRTEEVERVVNVVYVVFRRCGEQVLVGV